MTKLRNLLNVNSLTNLFTGAVLVTAASLVNGFFAYLLQIYLGRTLSIADYGTFNVFLSLFSILTVLNTGIGTATIKVVSELFGNNKRDELAKIFWKLTQIFSILGLIIFIVISVFREHLAAYFNITNPIYFIHFGLYLLTSYLLVTLTSYLLGFSKFKTFSYITTLDGFLRLAITTFFAYLGFNVGHLFLGISIGQLIIIVTLLYLLKKYICRFNSTQVMPYVKRIFSFSLPIFLIYFSKLLFYNSDILMVKNFFDPVSAGLYIGAATIGKMIIFGTGSVVLVMFPQISSLNAKSIDYKNKFWILTTIQVLLVLVALTAFILFPKPITLLFFGEKFSGSIHLVPKYALFASLYVVVNYFVMFFIAIDKTTVSFFLIPMAIAQIILINVYHNSLDQVVHTNIVVLSFLLICLLILLRITLKKVAFPKFN